mmetsp:Transcript_75755/g.239584  ORF Transcript_75755/g.239584 Transcript_75755/m.239584 type:complete len:209 (+) Transcript_75755:1100-1726(+)
MSLQVSAEAVLFHHSSAGSSSATAFLRESAEAVALFRCSSAGPSSATVLLQGSAEASAGAEALLLCSSAGSVRASAAAWAAPRSWRSLTAGLRAVVALPPQGSMAAHGSSPFEACGIGPVLGTPATTSVGAGALAGALATGGSVLATGGGGLASAFARAGALPMAASGGGVLGRGGTPPAATHCGRERTMPRPWPPLPPPPRWMWAKL